MRQDVLVQVFNGSARAPLDTRELRAQAWHLAARRLLLIAHRPMAGTRQGLSPHEWEHLARADELGSVLPWMPDPDHLVGWVASAPARHVDMAIALASTVLDTTQKMKFFRSLLMGEAGVLARRAVPACRWRMNSVLKAMFAALPMRDLVELTAPHAGAWPCYTDRVLALSAIWRDTDPSALLAGLESLSSPAAAETVLLRNSEISAPSARTAVALIRRLPPSPGMWDLLRKFCVPDVELYAGLTQLQMPNAGAEDDAQLAPELI
jgi:hypothetical protein